MSQNAITIPRTVAGIAVLALAAALALAPGVGAQDQENEDVYLTAKGRVTFRIYCANCHGAKAKGDGDIAQYLKIPPADLTQIASRNGGKFPRQRVYETIEGSEEVKTHGARDMPIWGDAFQKTLQRTWQDISDEERAKKKIEEVVSFLASIQEEPES